jgi:hypothetical protein
VPEQFGEWLLLGGFGGGLDYGYLSDLFECPVPYAPGKSLRLNLLQPATAEVEREWVPLHLLPFCKRARLYRLA